MDTSGCTGITEHDLVSYGVLGLVKAAERYNKGRRVRFKTYAEHLVVGAMRDGVRKWRMQPRKPEWVRIESMSNEDALGELDRKRDEDARNRPDMDDIDWLRVAVGMLHGQERELIQRFYLDEQPPQDIFRDMRINGIVFRRVMDSALSKLRFMYTHWDDKTSTSFPHVGPVASRGVF